MDDTPNEDGPARERSVLATSQPPLEVSLTFRGVPVSEELLYYARALRERFTPSPRALPRIEVFQDPSDRSRCSVVLWGVVEQRRVRVEARGDPFVALREVFERLALLHKDGIRARGGI